LLYNFPKKYGNETTHNFISELKTGDFATIFGEVVSSNIKKSFQKQINIAEIVIKDIFGKKIKATFFSQPYVSKMLPEGSLVKLSGNVSGGKTSTGKEKPLSLINPDFSKVDEIPLEKTSALFENSENDNIILNPVYRETKFISSK
jgi:RecG-like helicase